MLNLRTALALALFVLVSPASYCADRIVVNFNQDWRFTKSDPPGASQPNFSDARWEHVSLPHTFNDVDTFDDWSPPGVRGELKQWSGRTWYRKTFRVQSTWRGRRIIVEFEGARQIAEVYFNGHLLGISRTGFTPFGVDLTPWVELDRPNILAVMVDNRFIAEPLDPAAQAEMAKRPGGIEGLPITGQRAPNLAGLQMQVNSRIPDRLEELRADQIPWNDPRWHPAHGGLYRNARLYVLDQVHIGIPLYSFLESQGPYIYTTNISVNGAGVHIDVPVENHGRKPHRIRVAAVVKSPASAVAELRLETSAELAAGANGTVSLSGTLSDPALWSPDKPARSSVSLHLYVEDVLVDGVDVLFGVRVARWTEGALELNGSPLKLVGWGQKPTNEWPGLGAALPDWLHVFTIQMMKDAGANFIRWGHCAAGPTQIAAADRLGLVVDQPGVDGESDTVGAAWRVRVIAFRDAVIYFRNSPSILVWEGGNQKVSSAHAQELRKIVSVYDPQGGRAYAHRRADAATAEVMDIGIATEGEREIQYLPAIEGEYDREESPRRVWDKYSPPHFGYAEATGMAYQLTSEEFAVNQVSQFVRIVDRPDRIGGANWIFSDTTSGGRVPAEVARASGEVDGARLPKEAYFVAATLFSTQPRVYVVGHWSYPEGTVKEVFVVSRAEKVELTLNGRSLGFGRRQDRYLFVFSDVKFEPGEIRAIAYVGNTAVASDSKRTTGPAVALRLTALTASGGLTADGSDIVLVDVEAIDGSGKRTPTAENHVAFQVAGPGVWRGGYNSGRMQSTNKLDINLEAGINRIAIRATRVSGLITVTATSPGLAPARITVLSKSFRTSNTGLGDFQPTASQHNSGRRRPVQRVVKRAAESR